MDTICLQFCRTQKKKKKNRFFLQYQNAIRKEGKAHETVEVISFGERLDPPPSPPLLLFLFRIESAAWMETRFLVNQGECLKAEEE